MTALDGITLAPGANIRINIAGKTDAGEIGPLPGGAQLAWTVEGDIGMVTTGHDQISWTPYGVLHVAPDAAARTGYVICEMAVASGTVTGRTVDVTVQTPPPTPPVDEITELVLTFQT